MSDLEDYAAARARIDPEFAEGLKAGYEELKIGVLLRQAREKAGLTQEQVAERLNTKKSAISRIENRAGDIRLSTLGRYAEAIGWTISINLQPPRSSQQAHPKPFVVDSRPMGLRPGLDWNRLHHVADALEDEARIAKLREDS